jgi:hypothetical protein
VVRSTNVMSYRLAPSTMIAIGIPFASVNKLRLTPPLSRFVGSLRFFPAQWSFRHRAVHCQPSSVNSIECLNRHASQAPKLFEDACVTLFLKPGMRRTARTHSTDTQHAIQTGSHPSQRGRLLRVMTAERTRLTGQHRRCHLAQL